MVRIGIDFDNTIASYDRLFAQLAHELGLIAPGVAPGGKRALRDALRARPDGERDWRHLQAIAYGPRLFHAVPMDGIAAFLRACRARGAEVHVVSHKTRYANAFSEGTNLHEVAMYWMRRQGFFAADGFGLDPAQVHFEASRGDKVARIAELGIDVFIDDLAEVFAEPGFPAATRKILFAPDGEAGDGPGDARPYAGARRARHWHEIRELVLGPAH